VLSEALSRDPSGLEAGDRQQLERLAATLHRWVLDPSRVLFVPLLFRLSDSTWSAWQQHCTDDLRRLTGAHCQHVTGMRRAQQYNTLSVSIWRQAAVGAAGSNTAQVSCAGFPATTTWLPVAQLDVCSCLVTGSSRSGWQQHCIGELCYTTGPPASVSLLVYITMGTLHR
jgi:hypothetical protein